MPTSPASPTSLAPQANNAHDILNVTALIRYHQTAAGLPVKSTGLAAIKADNYASWPGLTHTHANKYCPGADKTIKGHMVQTFQGVCSTKPCTPPRTTADTSSPPTPEPVLPSGELYIWEEPITKLYMDNMGRFPIRSHSGNLYHMLAYHCD